MTISPVLIVKNEEEMLPRCLESVKGLDEPVVIDTGSSDKTVEIAKKYTDKVYTDFTWCDDFAKARNYAKSKCTSDWILSIDADEALKDVSAVREAVAIAESKGIKAIDTLQMAEDNGQTFFFPRLFKNLPEVFWENPVHNTLSVLGERIGNVRISVGYSPAHKNDPDRAFRILKKDVESRFHPRSMFYLGREYFYKGDYANCVQMMGKYVQHSNFLAEKAEAFLTMARAYWAMRMGDDARDACAQALIINSRFKEACLFMAELSWEHNAVQWRRMAATASNEDVLFVRSK